MILVTTKERIIQYIDYKGVNVSEFLRLTGIKRGFLDADKLKSSVSDVYIAKIIATCADLNIEWLLTGNGSMLKEDPLLNTKEVPSFRKTSDPLHEIQRIPLFRLEATMGIVPLLSNNGIDPDCIVDYLSIPDLAKCDGAIYATGDSMHPLLKSGDIVAYKIITPENIFFGEMYLLSVLLDEDTSYKTIKWVQKSELGDDYVKLVSQNQHHAPKDIKISQIAAIGMIRASIRLHN